MVVKYKVNVHAVGWYTRWDKRLRIPPVPRSLCLDLDSQQRCYPSFATAEV